MSTLKNVFLVVSSTQNQPKKKGISDSISKPHILSQVLCFFNTKPNRKPLHKPHPEKTVVSRNKNL